MRVTISAFMLLLVVSCSQNNDTIYDCDGVEVVINDMKRKFVVSGVDPVSYTHLTLPTNSGV